MNKDKVLRRVLRRERFIEGAEKVLGRQKHVRSQSTTPFACTLKIGILVPVCFGARLRSSKSLRTKDPSSHRKSTIAFWQSLVVPV